MSGSKKNDAGGAREGPAASDPFTAAMGQIGQSWSASVGMWSAMTEAWQSVLRNKGVPAAQAMVNQVANPGAWPGGMAPLLEELQEILALPRLADLPTTESGALPSLAPAFELMSVAQQYVMAAAPVWVRACQRFQTLVAERGQSGAGSVDSAGDALDLWNNALDQTLMEFNRSADFAKVQQRFLQAANRQRLEVRKVGEHFARSVDLPTRSEIDDVYRRLHDLLREVHGLRREIRSLKQEAAGKISKAKRVVEGSVT